uniref:BED-type domain-containing protein n=1 Tax=Knipowitschia caucasica TaxID=637954 RepID=A0AAV2MRK3_KNICA
MTANNVRPDGPAGIWIFGSFLQCVIRTKSRADIYLNVSDEDNHEYTGATGLQNSEDTSSDQLHIIKIEDEPVELSSLHHKTVTEETRTDIREEPVVEAPTVITLGNMSVPLLEVKKEEWDSEITDESDSPEDDQETTGGKRRSKVWDHFDLLPPNKVRCLLCTQILSYTNNTSSMLRHVRAKHDVCQQQLVHNDNGHSSVSKKKMLDDAIVDMIIRDGQPFTVMKPLHKLQQTPQV